MSVSNALLMSSAPVIARSGGLLWLKPVAMVLFMLCSAVLVEWLFLKPCCVEMGGMLFMMYGSSVFSSVLVITEISEVGLYYVPMFMSYFVFGIEMMFGPMCLRCLILTLSGPVELWFLLCFIATWTCVVVSVMLVFCLSVFLSM